MLSGYVLGETKSPCPYINGQTFTSENYQFEDVGPEDIDELLARGYRHFGKYFFRPVCEQCHRCLPVRIPVADFCFSRNAKRLFRKNAHFTIRFINKPVASKEKFALYKKHKKRFSEEYTDIESADESYEIFIQSFYTNFTFSKILEIYDGDRLISVTHLDEGKDSLSAIYCYYDTDYLHYSPGKYSIYRGIEYAQEIGKRYYYLGYYISENNHMAYKGQYKPNEILIEEGKWVANKGVEYSFKPKYRLL